VDAQQSLREELLHLKMNGKRATQEAVAEQLDRQNRLLSQIEQIREQQMLPILEELAHFIASQRIQGVAD